MIRTLQADEHQRGCLMEDRVLKGDLAHESSMPRLVGEEERFVLLAMHQTLVERGIALGRLARAGRQEEPGVLRVAILVAARAKRGLNRPRKP